MKTFSFSDNTRKKKWNNVISNHCAKKIILKDYELCLLKKLSDGLTWINMVQFEWRDSYNALYDQAQNLFFDENEKNKIKIDVNRTFGLFVRYLPEARDKITSNLSSFYDSLYFVLITATHERCYCQGINFLAGAFLIKDSSERTSFILLCYLLRERHLEVLFNYKSSALSEYLKVFEKKLRLHNKKVYDHLQKTGFGAFCYAIEWFTTCFVVVHPGDLSSMVLDMLLMGFDDIMIRVGLAVLDLLEDQLLTYDLEELQLSFKILTRQLDAVAVVSSALAISLHRASPTASSPRSDRDVLQNMAVNIHQMIANGTKLEHILRHPISSHVSVSEQQPPGPTLLSDLLSETPLCDEHYFADQEQQSPPRRVAAPRRSGNRRARCLCAAFSRPLPFPLPPPSESPPRPPPPASWLFSLFRWPMIPVRPKPVKRSDRPHRTSRVEYRDERRPRKRRRRRRRRRPVRCKQASVSNRRKHDSSNCLVVASPWLKSVLFTLLRTSLWMATFGLLGRPPGHLAGRPDKQRVPWAL